MYKLIAEDRKCGCLFKFIFDKVEHVGLLKAELPVCVYYWLKSKGVFFF